MGTSGWYCCDWAGEIPIPAATVNEITHPVHAYNRPLSNSTTYISSHSLHVMVYTLVGTTLTNTDDGYFF